MPIAQIIDNVVHWITPYQTMDEIPEHPEWDEYIEIPKHVMEGWIRIPSLVAKSGFNWDPPSPPVVDVDIPFEQAQAIMLANTFGLAIEPYEIARAQASIVHTARSAINTPILGEWVVGEWVDFTVDDEVRRTYNGKTYDLIQPHMTQIGWEPPNVPALWSEHKEEWNYWKQPTGAHDAYPKDAKVTHNGIRWLNIFGDGNVWEPGVFGWQQVE